jgi:hypothetical protein
MNIFELWNEPSVFPLFLMGKITLIYECFGLRARFWNELCPQTKVPLYSNYISKMLSEAACISNQAAVWTLCIFSFQWACEVLHVYSISVGSEKCVSFLLLLPSPDVWNLRTVNPCGQHVMQMCDVYEHVASLAIIVSKSTFDKGLLC